MHYYEHNIGDYRKDTSHLSLLEHGIYRQLIDTYYLSESPLTSDLDKLMRTHSIRNTEEMLSFSNVLNDFFELTEEGYIHKRCDDVIAKYHGKSDKARASANARWANKDKGVDANAKPTQSEGNANHKPITNNHKPNITTPEGVSDSVFKDYLEVRKTKKAKWTDTALKGLIRESEKAGISLQEAMEICCSRGWVGFNADWVKDQQTTNTNNDKAWMFTDAGVVAKASELGIHSIGLSYKELKDKCLLIMAKRAMQ
jgi:uncharacterized protein YdaU (DUF1376 family)